MAFLDAVRLALAQIRVQKLKSFFTLLGVTIGVMFLIAVVSIVEGMAQYVENDFAGRLFGVNTITVQRFPNFDDNVSQAERLQWSRRPRITASDVAFMRTVLPANARTAIQAEGNLWAASKYVARPRQIAVSAVDGEYFTIKKYDLVAGRAITAQEYELGTPVIVIGDEVAKYFFPSLDPIGRELRIGAIPYRVVGMTEHQGSLFGISMDKFAVAPFKSQAGRLVNPRGDVDGFVIQAQNDVEMTEMMEVLGEAMRGYRRLRPAQPNNFAIESSKSAVAFFAKIKQVMTIAGTALPAIGLVVGGMVIMNIMLVAVAERTHEIGIRKSLGARRKDILSQFLVEAATLSTMGAILGILLGLLGAKIIEWQTPLPAAVAPWSIVAATLLGTVVGIISGVYPARRASRLDPIEALRQE